MSNQEKINDKVMDNESQIYLGLQDVRSDFQQIMDNTAQEQANKYVGQLNKKLNEAKGRDNQAYSEVAGNDRTAQLTLSVLNQKLDNLDKK